VDLTAVRTVAAPTGIALVHVDAAGQNCITVIAGANAHADSEAIAETLLAPVTTLLLQLEVPLGAILDIVARARARGARIVLNAAPALALPAKLLSAVDVLIVNEIEAARSWRLGMHAMPGGAPAMLVARLRRSSRSAQGALAATSGRLVRLVALPVRWSIQARATRSVAPSPPHPTGSAMATAGGGRGRGFARLRRRRATSLPQAAAIHRLAAQVESTLVSHSLD
jgi:ribokinase